jgi:hypothetical protein
MGSGVNSGVDMHGVGGELWFIYEMDSEFSSGAHVGMFWGDLWDADGICFGVIFGTQMGYVLG